MTGLSKASKKAKIDLWKVINLEFKLIKSSDTIGGALTNFALLFEKLQTIPSVHHVISHMEKKLVEEDQITFERLSKAVEWFHSKLRGLSMVHGDVNLLFQTEALLRYEVLELGEGGYLRALLFNLKYVAAEVGRNRKNHFSAASVGPTMRMTVLKELFSGWARIDKLSLGEFCFSEFFFPDFVKQVISKLGIEQEIYRWKEETDSSLLVLLRFLKILSLYKSFTLLILHVEPFSYAHPKNLQESEQRQYQAVVGYYLSLFESSNACDHPLSIGELIKLIERFVFMLEKEISTPMLKGPALKKKMSEDAESYCISELVNHVRGLSEQGRKEFRKLRYAVEIYELLSQKAKECNLPFASYITPTMLRERGGPKANRILFESHGVILHPIPQQGGVQSSPL